MKEFKGNVEITQSNYKKWEKKLKRIDVISGDLSIYSKVKLDNLKSIGRNMNISFQTKLQAPNLKSVGGNLYIYSQAKLQAPNLKSIGGNLNIYSKTKLDNLKSIGGNLNISSKTKLDNLKSVGGGLYIYSQAKLQAPNLKSVGGNLNIYSKAKLDNLKSIGRNMNISFQTKLNNLKSIGENLNIYSQAKLDNLKSVGGSLYINPQAKLHAPNLKSVGGGLYIYSQAKLQAPNLKSIGGNLYISSKIDNDLAIRLVNNCFKHQWYLSDEANNSLLRVKFPKAKYLINNVYFEKELFDKVRKDKLTAQEVFALTNLEQRRIAYERMDKIKMKQLKGFKVLDKVKDERGKIMKIVSFNIDGFDTPFYFLNVVCPTGREYFIETRKTKCFEAKTNSFGLPLTARAVKEW